MFKTNNSSSSTKEAETKAEAIIICLDSGEWMENTKSPMFMEQASAMQYYCEKKFKYNPRTIVGVCGSRTIVGVCGSAYRINSGWIHPTRDLKMIMSAINGIMFGEHIQLFNAVKLAHSLWFDCRLGEDMQKRIVFFAGGTLYCSLPTAHLLGKQMKDSNVACDVISFGDPYMEKRLFFDTLIRLADNDGNCNICHVPPELSARQALYRSQIFIPRVGGGSGSAQSSSFSSLPQHDKNKAIVVYVKAPPSDADDRRTDCPFCQSVLLVLEEKNILYDREFIDLRKKPKWFFKVNPHGILPLIKFSDGRYVSNSDVILRMIEEMYPDRPLVAPPYLACLGLKILPKIAGYLKREDKNDDWLPREFRKLEAHLENCEPFVNGKEITAVDLSLAPKLYHLLHACKVTIPQDLPYVQRYAQMLFDRPSFRKTKPSIEDVEEGWCKRLILKILYIAFPAQPLETATAEEKQHGKQNIKSTLCVLLYYAWNKSPALQRI
ncbi:dehydroascorbate reductase 2 [Tanacetum coccineum]|uniref:glutathione transferase n=1 Tax=Tanacetum coccineum TaxID=301880 RepID=A0ABQ5A331_9ASTR